MRGDDLSVWGEGGSGGSAPVRVRTPEPGVTAEDVWVLVLLGCLLQRQVGTVRETWMGLGRWHGTWVKQGCRCSGVEDAPCMTGVEALQAGGARDAQRQERRVEAALLQGRGAPGGALFSPTAQAGGALPAQPRCCSLICKALRSGGSLGGALARQG